MKYRLHVLSALAALLMLVGGGCATTPSTFYMLSALDGSGSPAGSGMSIGVGPASFPEYLDRPQIVTRPEPNRLELDEFHRWGGSLKGDFLRVLAQNLSVLLKTDNVAVYPWDEPFDPSYRVIVDVRRFDGAPGGEVRLDARWSIAGSQRSELLEARQSRIREPVDGAGYDALVKAQSLALEALSRDIAGSLSRLSASAQ